MVEIDKFLWCFNSLHDKYWGWIRLGDTYYNFWGKRGNKKITFKRYADTTGKPNVTAIVPLKLSIKLGEKLTIKGYKDFTGHNKIERFFPNFHKEFEIQLTLARLGDDFHNEK